MLRGAGEHADVLCQLRKATSFLEAFKDSLGEQRKDSYPGRLHCVPPPFVESSAGSDITKQVCSK